MTTIYEVQVERTGFGSCHTVRVAHKDNHPELAAEAAERIIARAFYGDDWAKVVHQFFAYRVRELTGADMLDAISAPLQALAYSRRGALPRAINPDSPKPRSPPCTTSD